jgi:predicted ArsR family transcriptional regulator
MTQTTKNTIKEPQSKPQKEEQKSPPKKTKKAIVQEMLQSENGTTREEIANKTGWQPHTVRGHLSSIKKEGCNVISEEKDGKRRYKIST